MGDRTVHVGNLETFVNESTLYLLFSQFGTVTNVRLAGDPKMQTRYAFVEFNDSVMAHAACLLDGLQVGSRNLRVSLSKPYAGKGAASAAVHNPLAALMGGAGLAATPAVTAAPRKRSTVEDQERISRTIHVRNVDIQITEAMLVEYFGVCGTVTAARTAGTNNPRTAWIEFAAQQSALAALSLDGQVLAGQTLRISPSKSAIQTNALSQRNAPAPALPTMTPAMMMAAVAAPQNIVKVQGIPAKVCFAVPLTSYILRLLFIAYIRTFLLSAHLPSPSTHLPPPRISPLRASTPSAHLPSPSITPLRASPPSEHRPPPRTSQLRASPALYSRPLRPDAHLSRPTLPPALPPALPSHPTLSPCPSRPSRSPPTPWFPRCVCVLPCAAQASEADVRTLVEARCGHVRSLIIVPVPGPPPEEPGKKGEKGEEGAEGEEGYKGPTKMATVEVEDAEAVAKALELNGTKFMGATISYVLSCCPSAPRTCRFGFVAAVLFVTLSLFPPLSPILPSPPLPSPFLSFNPSFAIPGLDPSLLDPSLLSDPTFLAAATAAGLPTTALPPPPPLPPNTQPTIVASETGTDGTATGTDATAAAAASADDDRKDSHGSHKRSADDTEGGEKRARHD
ncbi:unnamed protein product [Closterium sp. NIES-65]|nr:unnamed protein product [Closterium sp. NIES-65]